MAYSVLGNWINKTDDPGLVGRDISKASLDYIEAGILSASVTADGALQRTGGTMTGLLTLNADPTTNLHAATKQYVDAARAGLSVKAAVRAATTANITLSGTQTVDAVVLIAGDRVLVKNQTTASQNGIYVVASGAWSRATDADASGEVTAGMFTFVAEGTLNHDAGFVLATDNPITLDTTALTFTQFSSSATTGGGGSGIQSVDTIAALQGLTGTSVGDHRIVDGYYAVEDGGDVGLVRRTSSGATVDGVGVFSCADGGTARWEAMDISIPLNVWKAGVMPDGTDQSASWARVMSYLATNGEGDRSVFFPAGRYRFNSTIVNTTRDIRIIGERSQDVVGSALDFAGTGPFWQNGTDNGQPLDGNFYDGPAGLTFEDIGIFHISPDTNLANGIGQYKAGGYGIRDFRGGDIYMKNCTIQKFEFGFWGAQSDINKFERVVFAQNKRGAWVGPRSDQNTLEDCYSFNNDGALEIDGARGTRIEKWVTVNDGNSSNGPFIISGSYSIPTTDTVFEQPWAEHYGGSTTAISFWDIGTVGTTTTPVSVIIRDVTILDPVFGATSHVPYLLRVQAGNRIRVEGVSNDTANIDKWVQFIGTASPQVYFEIHADHDKAANNYINSGSGAPQFFLHQWGNSSQQFNTPNTRVFFRGSPRNTLRDFYLSAEADQTLFLVFPDDGSGNTTRLKRSKRDVEGTAAPSTLAWVVGDFVKNTAPATNGIWGWICVTAGTPGTWQAIALPGTVNADAAASGGVTLTTSSPRMQRFTGTFTASRTITMPAAGLFAGDTFQVVRRQASGTIAAFSLAVGAVATIPNSFNGYVAATWDGAAWVMTGGGLLNTTSGTSVL